MKGNTRLYMDDSLKLSYEMLFQNGSSPEETKTIVPEEDRTFSSEEVEALLQERDEKWEKRLKQGCEDARQTGFENGYTEGKHEAEAEIENRLSALNEMMNKLNTKFNDALEELKPHIAGLVFEITEKVLNLPFQHAELQRRVQDEVRQLVEKLDEQLHIRVTLSEEDFEVVQQALGGEAGIANVSLRVDEQHNPGEYAVETKKECIIKNFNKMVADFKESISFAEVDSLRLDS